MARRLLGLVLFGAGCTDINPKFIATAGDTNEAPTGTDSAGSTAAAGETTESTLQPTGGMSGMSGMTGMTSMTGMTGGPGETSDSSTTALMTSTTASDTTDPATTMAGPSCGDGKVEQGEDCDDGNGNDLDACSNTCTVTFCGDGFIQDGEACDDGKLSPTSPCLPGCVLAVCGDGFTLAGVEQCDDGNPDNQDDCDTKCLFATKTVFVSSKQYNGVLGGLVGADMYCQKLAAMAGLPGDFKAWLSTGPDSPVNRMKPSKGPYMLVDGTTKIADDWNDLLSGGLDSPISQTEVGTTPEKGTGCGNANVYTNTKPDGTTGAPYTDCGGWTGGMGVSWWGNSSKAGKEWTDACMAEPCGALASLYCFQQ